MAHQLVPPAATGAAPVDESVSVLDQFDEWLERTPVAAAVRCGAVTLTYAEVDRRACRLACELRDRGVGPERVVGVLMERSAELPVALLGVLRAGAAYLPVNPADPDDYLAASFGSAGVGVVVTDPGLAGRAAGLGPGLRGVTAGGDDPGPGQWIRPKATVRGDSLQYVIRTSGSTGRPKAIAMTHHPQVRLVEWSRMRYAERATALHYFPATSDVASLEIFMTWGTGGCLVVATDAERHDIAAVAGLVANHSITRALLPVAVLHQLAEHCAPDFSGIASLRELITTGERLTITPELRDMVTALGDGTVLDDHYGSSEVNVVVAPRLEQPAAAWPDQPLLGAPIVGARVYVLEPALTPAPRNVVGEIYIGGDPLARGYLGQGGVTAQSFVPDPFSATPGARMYRTGDLGRWRTGGRLEFMGRSDFQVKVRGYRVEPAEVERALAAHPQVDRAAVLLAGIGPDDRPALTAYVTRASAAPVDVDTVRAHASSVLPAHMVPEVFVVINAFPLLATGKVDRAELPRPNPAAPETVRSRTDTEAAIAEIWSTVLGRDVVGVRDNFFALGGHSLLVARVVYEIREVFDVDLPLVAVFEHPTVEGLAGTVEKLVAEDGR
ncbi:MAG: hypothetical protein V7637_1945 [Mycobacteriales bacterium]|jgi:amino acid adenylation domain-containing protein